MVQPKEVLLVDDEKQQARLLQMLMETRGYEVGTAFSGADALKKVSPRHDLVILDLVLPDIDGFEVCRRLKQDEQLKHIPVIILSAYSFSEDKVKSFYLGADDFLAKPCEHEELFARMDAIFRRKSANCYSDEKIITELHRIRNQRNIVSYYQPIYQLYPFELLGFEALTRPITQGHLKNPEQFFKVALQYGIYPEVELLGWANALVEISRKKFYGKIFLNCNPYFIESVEFSRVAKLVENCGIDPSSIVLEITEMSAVLDFHLFYEKLMPYKEYGFTFAIDDLGRGYSSLESLVEIRPEFVKIDGYIIRDLYRNELKRSVVEFVIEFCKRHKILVVAEGIETQEDLQAARAIGLDAGQGYYLCRPQPEFSVEMFKEIPRSSKFNPFNNSFSI